MPFTRIHSSGHVSQSADSLRKAITLFSGMAEVITVTECPQGAREQALSAPGFTRVHGKSGDAGQLGGLFDDKRFKVVGVYEAPLTNLQYTRVGGAKAPANEALVIALKDLVESKVLVMILAHTPAGIEGSSGPGGIWKNYFRSSVARAAITGMKAVKKEAHARFQPDAMILDADWNLNIERADVRAFFKLLLPRFTPNWAKYDTKGTLGKRFIDVGFLRGLKVTVPPVPHDTPSSDHRYYIETLEYTTPGHVRFHHGGHDTHHGKAGDRR